jgi:hypothetical protein
MAFQVSAGVEVKEIDLTNVVPAVSTSIGGYAGTFRWGPIEEIKLIGSESELANEFGKPDSDHARSFYTASSFLKYGSALKTVRASNSSLKNSSSASPNGSITDISISGTVAGDLATIDASTTIGNNEYSVVSTTGSGAEIAPRYGVIEVDSSSIAQGGIGYKEGDKIKIDLGESKEIILNVTQVDDGSSGPGAITDVDFLTDSNGIIYDSPVGANGKGLLIKPTKFSNQAAIANSPGVTGTGALINLTYKLEAFNVIEGGIGYFNRAVSQTNVENAIQSGDSPRLQIFKDGTEIYPINETDNKSLSPRISVTGNGGGKLIKNDDDFEAQTDLVAAYYSRYAGKLGDGTNVYVITSANAGTLEIGSGPTLANSQFDAAPDSGEVHVLVTSTADALTDAGTAETVIERWPFLSTTDGAKKEDGTNNYFKDVINTGSDWIYVGNGSAAQHGGNYVLNGGEDAGTRDDGEISDALDLLADSETEDVNLLFTEEDTNGKTTLANKVLSIATARKDCVGFITPPIEDTVNTQNPLDNVKDFLQSTSAVITPRNSYGVLGSTAVYVYDKFNDKFLYIGTQGHLAGLCANTDQVAETWFSPGGFNRGQLRGVTKLAFNPSKIQRDELYKAGINPIVTFPGQGTVLFGDKTLQAKPSAFDRINVRRLFITLEKAIATAAKFQLFELNDEFTRASFRNLVEPFLRDVQGRRGITDFLVVCDETNNTGQVIDSNRFVADIFIKPARSINFITLNFIATRTGVEFSEIVGNV